MLLCSCEEDNYDNIFPIVEFNIGGHLISLRPSFYLMYQAKDQKCRVTFEEEKDPSISYWIFGDAFMRAFYLIYNVKDKQIGILDLSLPAATPDYTVENSTIKTR